MSKQQGVKGWFKRRLEAVYDERTISLSIQDRFDLDTVLAREIRMSEAADPELLGPWKERLKDLRRRLQ